MATLIKNVRVIDPISCIDQVDDVFISPDEIALCPHNRNFTEIIDGTNKVLAPGLVDLHVHFREPGFMHKETIASGINAALAGGVTSALVMPNTSPSIDTFKHVSYQHARSLRTGFDLMVAGAATSGLKGEAINDIAALKSAGAKAITDDGRSIASDSLMEKILRQCRLHRLVCMQHAEDLRLSGAHAVNAGRAAMMLGILGQKADAEFAMIKRDIALAERIGARYHVLHLSCRQSLREVERAKARGVAVSCEVAPHHLLLCDDDVVSGDTFKKMNPPLRSREDASALVNALTTTTIDAVASDHAPHSLKEKRLPLVAAPFGVIGLESSMLALLTLVKRQMLSLTRAIELMTVGPARVLGEEGRIGSLFSENCLKNAVLLDTTSSQIFSVRDCRGTSINSAFFGVELFGRVLATFLNGEIRYRSQA